MANGFQQGWRPGRFKDQDVDNALKRAFDNHYNLATSVVTSPTLGTGYALTHGSQSVTGSKTAVVTGLSTVDTCGGTLQTGATATNYTVSVVPSKFKQGAVDIYVWMPTSSSDNTPIAATAAVTVSWWARGGV